MAETLSLAPTSHFVPSGKPDWRFEERLYRTATGTNAMVGSQGVGTSVVFNGIFSSEIPLGATIVGMELTSENVNSSDGRLGTAGTTLPDASATIEVYFYNGTSYTSAILSQTFTGANDYNPSTGQGTGVVMGGSPSNTYGLTWNPANQSSFGFRIDITAQVNSPLPVGLRGLSMKVYYTEAPTGNIKSFSGVNLDDISTIDAVSLSDISSISGVSKN